jgi:hypothetical protein
VILDSGSIILGMKKKISQKPTSFKEIEMFYAERERRISALEKQMKLIGRKLKLDFNKLSS